jgi:hypothetical protein
VIPEFPIGGTSLMGQVVVGSAGSRRFMVEDRGIESKSTGIGQVGDGENIQIQLAAIDDMQFVGCKDAEETTRCMMYLSCSRWQGATYVRSKMN